MQLPWRSPPPATPAYEPPENDFPGLVICTLLVAFSVQYIHSIIRHYSRDTAGFVLSKENAHWCVPFYSGFLLLSHLGLYGVGYELQSPLPPELGHDSPVTFLYMLSPVVGFSLLLVSEFLSWVFMSILGPARRYAHFRHPIMAVHSSTLLFYTLSYTHGAVALVDRFGRPLYPVRYVHWFLSVSSLGQSVYMLLTTTPTVPDWLHGVLMRYLLAVPVCFVSGFLASHLLPLAPSMACLALSFAAFWYMLSLMLRMLRVGEVAGVRTGNAQQFVAIRVSIFIVWHGFTVVWLLAAVDWITPLAEHGLYVLCDLLAKYLILFVSIASVN